MAVSLQAQACDALAAFLQAKMPTIPVESDWPARDRDAPPQMVTIVTAGRRRDYPMELRQLSQTNNGANNTDAVWQIAACEQGLSLDVWSDSEAGRDDIVAQLDQFLHLGESTLSAAFCPTPAGNGILLSIGNDTIVDYDFGEPDYDDSSDDMGREIFRATYSGNAYFMLTVTSTTPRQKVIELLQEITE